MPVQPGICRAVNPYGTVAHLTPARCGGAESLDLEVVLSDEIAGADKLHLIILCGKPYNLLQPLNTLIPPVPEQLGVEAHGVDRIQIEDVLKVHRPLPYVVQEVLGILLDGHVGHIKVIDLLVRGLVSNCIVLEPGE